MYLCNYYKIETKNVELFDQIALGDENDQQVFDNDYIYMPDQ